MSAESPALVDVTDDASLARVLAPHRAALEAAGVRHNIILSVIEGIESGALAGLDFWSLGEAGACALQGPRRPIVLGDLSREQCAALAQSRPPGSYRAVVGPGETARWFADAAAARGVAFLPPMPQMIHALTTPAIFPGAPGSLRLANADDLDLVWDWVVAFVADATPDDAPPPREMTEKSIAAGRYFVWTVEGVPVSLAGFARSTRTMGAIAPVYTPPALRGRGYAGSAVAALSQRIFASGRAAVCLYTDMRNPASNRCYAKVGFVPVCELRHYAVRGA